TFTTGGIQIKDAAGNPLTVLSVTPLVDTVGPANRPTVPGVPADYHDLFQVVVAAKAPNTSIAPGFADVVIGPGVADYAGFGMNQNDNFRNGETAVDPNNFNNPADAYHGFLLL